MHRNIWIVVAFVAVAIVAVAVGYLAHTSQVSPPASTTAPPPDQTAAPEPQAANGELQIWIPTGVVGSDYWVYVNGHLQSTPPGTRSNSGWTISFFGGSRGAMSGNTHLVLQNGDFTDQLANYAKRNVDPASGDAGHLFTLLDLRQIPPGQYTVEVAYLTQTTASFPFTITRKYVDFVHGGAATQMFIGVPDDWSNLTPARAAYEACSELDGKPEVDKLKADMDRYLQDAAVHALRAMEMSAPSSPDGTIVLDMAPEEGGSREFNRAQIRDIANAILGNYGEPSHAEVATCKARYPQFSQQIDAYDRLLGDFDKLLQPIADLAAN